MVEMVKRSASVLTRYYSNKMWLRVQREYIYLNGKVVEHQLWFHQRAKQRGTEEERLRWSFSLLPTSAEQ